MEEEHKDPEQPAAAEETASEPPVSPTSTVQFEEETNVRCRIYYICGCLHVHVSFRMSYSRSQIVC